MAIRWLAITYAALAAAAVVAFLSWPSITATSLNPVNPVAVVAVGATSAAAVMLGVRRYRPHDRRPWHLLALALTLNAAARAVYLLLPGELGSIKPLSWIVYALQAVMFVALVVGLRIAARSNVRGWVAVVDATVILLGAGLFATTFIALPYANTPGLSGMQSAVAGAYLIRDVIVIAVMIDFVASARWNASVLALFTGVASLLGYDVLIRLGRIHGGWPLSIPIAASWLVFFLGVAVAALTRSMAAIAAPATSGREVAPMRLGILTVAALLPSAVLVIGAFRKQPWYQRIEVVVATVILVLVLVRITDVALRLRRQLAAERALQMASAELAAALDASAVTIALDVAVRRLLAPGTSYQLAVLPPGIGIDDFHHRAEPASGWHAGLGDGHHNAALEIPLSGQWPAGGRTTPSNSDLLRGFGLSHPAPHQQPTLVVRTDRASIAELKPRLEVLANLAAVALERIRLSDEISRSTSDAYFRTLVHNSADIILIVNDRDSIDYASPSARTIFGGSVLLGTSLPSLLQESQQPAARAFLSRARAKPSVDEDARPPVTVSNAEGDWVVPLGADAVALLEVSCRDLRDDPTIKGLIVTLSDVTERRRLETEISHRSLHDALTGLDNRLPFSEELERAVAANGRLTAVLYVDLDDLKLVNDSLGHETGDIVLTAVGERLRGFVNGKPNDMAARLGGDEFAVLLADTESEEADDAADRLVAVLGEPVDVDGHDVSCRASVGVATMTDDVTSGAELLRNADLALYAAKGMGKGRWRRYEPWMRSTVMARLELRTSLERAVEDEALMLEYQPIVDLHSRRPVGFEALLRWQHPALGLLAPDQFIDVAEESGLIVPIGEWVLAASIRAARGWPRVGSVHPYVGVNVSARQFRTPGFVSSVRRLLVEGGLPPGRLMLEITESLLLRDDESVWRDMQLLRQSGVRIAIDDFGTGYSALSYLRQVPLDVVKLDRLFIRTMTVSAQQRALVEGIVSLTSILGLQVIAEGIEAEEECALAVQVGCAYGQGFLFSRPMPEDRATQWLLARRAPQGPASHDRTPSRSPTDNSDALSRTSPRRK